MRKQSKNYMKLMAKMITYFLVVIIISGFGFGVMIYETGKGADYVTYLKDFEFPRLENINIVSKNADAQAAAIRGYMLTRQEGYLELYKRASDENARIEIHMVANASTEARRKKILELKTLDDQYTEIVENKVIPLIRAGRQAEALVVMATESAPVAQRLALEIAEYKQVRNAATRDAFDNLAAAAQATRSVGIMAAIIATILGIGIGFFAARSITKPINVLNQVAQNVADGDLTRTVATSSKDEIGQLTTAFNLMVSNLKNLLQQIHDQSQRVSVSSEGLTASAGQSAEAANSVVISITEVADGASEQLRAIKETTAVIEQMAAGLEEVAANANVVSVASERTASAAQAGEKSVQTAISQMIAIEKTVEHSAGVVTKLGDRSQEIGQIVDTISGIAGQTNLLALNAAIEAARAGEQGRGFAVVAEEVRRLAEQSQEAAKQIAMLINEIRSDTESAVAAMQEGTKEVGVGMEVVNGTGVTFKEIVSLIRQMAGQVRGISTAIEEMANGSQQITHSIQQIDAITRNAAHQTEAVSAATEEQSASIQEIAAASQNLSKLAQLMDESVIRFKM